MASTGFALPVAHRQYSASGVGSDTLELVPWNVKTVVLVASLAILWSAEALAPWIPDRHRRFRHTTTNLVLGALNVFVTGIVFAGATMWITTRAAVEGVGLLNLFAWPGWAEAGAAVVLVDGWQYLWHRLNHRIPVLWRFHSVHHADRDLDASTGVRFHPGEVVASAASRLAVWPLLGVSVGQVVLYEVLVLPVVLLHHSNVRFPSTADRMARALIVTPGMHRVHHSVNRAEHDSNYASLFSFWDRVFRSFTGARSDVEVGLTGVARRRWATLPGMLRFPFEPTDAGANATAPTEGGEG